MSDRLIQTIFAEMARMCVDVVMAGSREMGSDQRETAENLAEFSKVLSAEVEAIVAQLRGGK